ncbi:MAG: Unknown protein [uncultured Thiotrichaceae bacterium]|uniref:CcmD family protein n=1 Tax=uncultured Thiotrichaceae bacterium TaxID=298394 RepID=A0A6S6TBR5_9GAMM|nr:MAG: Unknown protein [uncultured Thiotrichaceae bacterium]
MSLFNPLLRVPVVALALLSSSLHAHPGHSHFGSADEEPGLVFLIWIGVILAMAVYGGWRLYQALTAKHTDKTNE